MTDKVRRLPCNHEQHHEWVDSRKERDENSHDISSLSESNASEGKKTNCREWNETDEEGYCKLKINDIVIDHVALIGTCTMRARKSCICRCFVREAIELKNMFY